MISYLVGRQPLVVAASVPSPNCRFVCLTHHADYEGAPHAFDLRVLRSSGIEITALHSHMLDEELRLFFMHFWAVDRPDRLAIGLRAALHQTARR